jgi:Arc/MetJ family transcription regulator
MPILHEREASNDMRRSIRANCSGWAIDVLLDLPKVELLIWISHAVSGAVLECVFFEGVIHIMRTNIVIDDKLMDETLRATGLKTKREAVELGLRTLLRLRQQEEIRKFRGKLQWEGDLDQMRTDR